MADQLMSVQLRRRPRQRQVCQGILPVLPRLAQLLRLLQSSPQLPPTLHQKWLERATTACAYGAALV